jgi:hypothetical protein
MSSQIPASLFCMLTLCCMSVAMQDLPRITLAEATGAMASKETVRMMTGSMCGILYNMRVLKGS